jgi:hypothetical protein
MLVRVEIEYRRRSENTLLKLLCIKKDISGVFGLRVKLRRQKNTEIDE